MQNVQEMNNKEIKTGIDISEFYNKAFSQAAIPNKKDDSIEDTHRTLFRRHRDRILYSGGFKDYKTKHKFFPQLRVEIIVLG